MIDSPVAATVTDTTNKKVVLITSGALQNTTSLPNPKITKHSSRISRLRMCLWWWYKVKFTTTKQKRMTAATKELTFRLQI